MSSRRNQNLPATAHKRCFTMPWRAWGGCPYSQGREPQDRHSPYRGRARELDGRGISHSGAATQAPDAPQQMATVEEAVSQKLITQGIPSRTIMDNMQHVAQHDPSAGRLAQILLKNFEQSRDALRKALGGPTIFGDQPPNT